MRRIVLSMVSFFIFIVLFSGFLWAITGKELAEKVYNRYDGDDAYYRVKMFLIDRRGKKREREMEILVKDFSGLNKTYIRFLAPSDIRGTSFLSIERVAGSDLQYLFLPDLGRSRRIVSSQKKRRFVNTDYTYEDMERRKPDQDTHRILGEEKVMGRDCYKLESVPKDGKSQYGKRISWVDKESYLILKTDFYDKKGRLVKQFRVDKIGKVGNIWTIFDSTMCDLKRDHKTKMVLEDVKYNQGLSDEVFTVRYMERHWQ